MARASHRAASGRAAVVSIAGVQRGKGGAPAPPPVDPPPGAGLLEREGELRRLDALLREPHAKLARVVLVEAAAGLGKTALLRYARDRARSHSHYVFQATADEPGRHIPFETMRVLFERLLDEPGREALFAGPAEVLKSVLADAPFDVGPQLHTVQHGCIMVCRRLAARAPVLLVIDDAHWADVASRDILAALIRRAGDCPLVILLATRPNEPVNADPVLARIAADADTYLLRPKPLSLRAAATLVRRELGEDADDRLCASCHDVTAGNPFFLRQLLTELRDEAVDLRDVGREEVQGLGPRSISRAVLVRLARLTPDAVAVCRAAAILGEHGSLYTVAALARLSTEAAALAADALAQVAIFRRSLSLAFVHPIVRSAVLADLAPHQRAALHADAVRILRAAGATAGAVAAHLLEVEPAGDEATVGTLLEAARDAQRQGAAGGAVAYLRRALAEPPPAALRARVLAELGRVELDRDPAASLPLLEEAADRLDDSRERLAVRRVQAEALVALGRTSDAVDLLAAVAEEAAARGETEAAARCEAQGLSAARGDRATRRRALERAERLDRLGKRSEVARVLALGNAAVETGLAGRDRARAVELAEAALGANGLLTDGDRGLATEAALVLAWADRIAEAEDALRRVLAGAERDADLRSRSLASALLAQLAFRRGAGPEAQEHVREALATATEAAWCPGVIHAVATFADVAIERGAGDEADALLTQHGLQQLLPPVWPSVFLYASRGRLRLARDDPEAARRDAERSLALQAEWGAANPSVAPAAEVLVRALERLGERAAAGAAAAADRERAERWGAPIARGRALRGLARLAPADEALRTLRSSVDELAATPARLELATARLELGAALRRAGQRAEARGQLADALMLAESCGSRNVARRAQLELEGLGVRRRRDEEACRDALTASERRVVELVAEGLPNREIAQRLFVTPKTVEAHLTSVYRKLGLRSRTELVRWVASESRASDEAGAQVAAL